jgi:hypothetical protein
VAGRLGVAQAVHPHRPGPERELSEPLESGERAPWRTLAVTLAAAAAFGVVMAVIKGQDAGVRDAIGNASAPWVVIPFLAGTRFRSVWRGLLVGVAATVAAFAGFYVAEAAVLDLGTSSWRHALSLTLGSGRIYEEWGLLSGALYGALGSLWATRRWLAAGAAVGLAFVFEPLIVWFLSRARVWGGSGPLEYRWMWLAEIALGLAAIAYFVRRKERASAGT